jgi:uncharacterized protein (DUF58 family)
MITSELLHKVRLLEIRTRRLAEDFLAGEYHAVFKGRGVEFTEVRAYQFGDDIRSIDWNVTARMGSPFVKRYIEERELTVLLVLDASGSMLFGTRNRPKADLAAEVSAVLAFSAIRNNDRVGLIIFSDTVEKYIPAKKGRNHVLRLIREILAFRPQGRTTNVAAALEYLHRVQKRKCVVFLLSDFADVDFERQLRHAGRKHDTIALAISDPAEHRLPKVSGRFLLEDPESGRTIERNLAARALRRLYHSEAWENTRSLRNACRRFGLGYVGVQTDADYIAPLAEFFARRRARY